MVPAKLIFLLALSPLVFDLDFSSSTQISKNDALPSQSACVNCTICPCPCHTLPPLPPSGYPLYGAPPAPASGNPSPPPEVQSNCSTVPVECCHNTPPPNTYLPNENFSPLPYPNVSFISFLFSVASFGVWF